MSSLRTVALDILQVAVYLALMDPDQQDIALRLMGTRTTQLDHPPTLQETME